MENAEIRCESMITRIDHGHIIKLSEVENAFANAKTELPAYMHASLEPSFERLRTSFLKRLERHSDYFQEHDKTFGNSIKKPGPYETFERSVKTPGPYNSNTKLPDSRESVVYALDTYQKMLSDSCRGPISSLEDRMYGLLDGEDGLSNVSMVLGAVKGHLTKASGDFAKFTDSVIRKLESAASGTDVNKIFSETCEDIRLGTLSIGLRNIDKEPGIQGLINKIRAGTLPRRTE